MTTKLKLYNDALTICGERVLASLTEDREPRRLLDQAYADDAIESCLELGQWKFAMRAVRLDYDTSVEPEFGYQRAFQKPTDWMVTSAVCSDEYYKEPLLQYVDEAGYWYADIDQLYVKYVSNDASYGGDLSLWPATFAHYVAAHFASRIIMKLTQDADRRRIVMDIEDKWLKRAKNRDAMAGPTTLPASGSWSRSRSTGAIRERGNRGSLIG